MLLLLYDPLADIPLGLQHHGVDGSIGIQTGILDQTFNVVDKRALQYGFHNGLIRLEKDKTKVENNIRITLHFQLLEEFLESQAVIVAESFESGDGYIVTADLAGRVSRSFYFGWSEVPLFWVSNGVHSYKVCRKRPESFKSITFLSGVLSSSSRRRVRACHWTVVGIIFKVQFYFS